MFLNITAPVSRSNSVSEMQDTSLELSQARDVAKLSFNFNASHTTVNLAKAYAKEKGIQLMASFKSMMHNAYMLEGFIHVSDLRPNRKLNDKLIKELIEFVAIAT